MQEGLLAEANDYSSKKLREQLKRWSYIGFIIFGPDHNLVCATKADQVFLPVIENSSKAQKLRSTLAVFERSKFFFNLPSSLMELIEAVSDH